MHVEFDFKHLQKQSHVFFLYDDKGRRKFILPDCTRYMAVYSLRYDRGLE